MRNIIILTFLLLFLLPGQGHAQLTKQQAEEQYEKFNSLWVQKDIGTDTFLKSMTRLSTQMLRQQPVFSTDELRHQLNNFREAAWSSDKYDKYKTIYFIILMNNADRLNKGGEAIFYAGKLEQVLPAMSINSKLQVTYMKCAFYDQNGNYEKATKAYQSKTKYIDSLIQSVPDSVHKDELMTAIQILSIVIHSYTELKDSISSSQVAQKAENLYAALLRTQNKAPTGPIMLCRVLVNFIQAENNLLLKHYAVAKAYLIQCDSLNNNDLLKHSYLADQTNASTFLLWLEYYLAVKDYPHAAYYLNRLDEGTHSFPDYNSFIFQKKAELSVIKNDYKAAYAFMKKALESKNKNLVSVTNDMNNLLYAHAEAEFNKAQLASAEKARKKRVILFTGVGLGLLAIILILIILYRRAKTKADKRIAALNAMADFQIATAKEEAVKEEQDRLARDLHDNYSASIAGILNRLESVSSEATGTTWGKEIEELSRYIEIIYQSVRKKSHELFRNAQDQQSVQLEKSILRMMEIALPSRRFKKEIDVETTAVSSLPLSHQIEILRIVQECMANIVKHGKNADEVFLFIFRENGGVTLQIGDNGKTANAHTSEKNSQTLGMESIRKRVASMKGNMTVNNDNGFTLAITIPD